MAMNTYMTFLMTSANGSTYTDLVPIKDYPDYLNEVATIDVTDLQNASHTYILGLGDTGGAMDFTANYTPANYYKCRQLDDGQEHYFAIYFGGTNSGGTISPTGNDGKWTFKGMLKVGIVGKAVDEAREMTIHVVPTTDIVPDPTISG